MRTLFLSRVACAISLLVTAMAVPSRAEEARCTALAANCVCSEPFNTNNLVVSGETKNPADSVTKQCSTGPVAGGALESNNVAQIIPRNDAAMMSALPATKTITYAVGTPDRGGLSYMIYFAGNKFASSQYTKRLAARFYMYHSPDYQFAQDGSCTNSKFMQFTGPNHVLDKSFGWIHAYNYQASQGWSPGTDCCIYGPIPTVGGGNTSKGTLRGKWWRFEFVMTNRAGPGYKEELWAKNITDNTPEVKVVDTGAPNTSMYPGDPVTSFPYTQSWTPPSRQDLMLINNYSENNCAGWLAFSHYMMAGWDTDSGQRIGSALEIEGVSGATGTSSGSTQTPPPAPTLY
jgi:hypothetical protein